MTSEEQPAIMRTVGHRKQRQITFSASAILLMEGAGFNDEIRRLPTGRSTFIPKGVYRFKSHEDANQHQQASLIEGMAQIALESNNSGARLGNAWQQGRESVTSEAGPCA